MSQNLYNYLVQNGDYTKSYDDFKSQFDTVASQSALYNYMNENQTYTKSQQEFLNQFFSKVIVTGKQNNCINFDSF